MKIKTKTKTKKIIVWKTKSSEFVLAPN